MKILTITTLYPNAAAPHHGVFVENRLRAFADYSGAEIRVVAPTPWFPVTASWAGRYAAFARAPAAETRRGFPVVHPRYAIPPKIGMTYAVQALERCFEKAARAALRAGFDFDLIDAHYLYPDGVAAARVATRLGKPVVLTARGTDVNLIPKRRRQRKMILDAVRSADAVICVAAALRKELIRLGAPAEKLHVLRNGVDLNMFRPSDRDVARRALAVSGDVIVSVGHLTERKGHHLVIEALNDIPQATLLIAGEGEMRAELEALAQTRGLSARVRFLGAVAHDRLAEVYNAADALALASSREGWPNVLLEAMACGTPAAATPVWGSVEVVRAPAAGALASERSGPAMAAAIKAILDDRPARADTRAYAERFSWDETSRGLEALFKEIIAADRSRRATRTFAIAARTPQPRLLVTIDTEEAFDWSRFTNVTYTVCPPSDIDRFHRLTVGHGARPLYFLTYPLLEDAAVAGYFRDRRAAGEADLGLHLHQWTTPPLEGFRGEHYSFQCNLPPAAYRAKLFALADAFESVFGGRARAHRAGRYGIAPWCYEALAAAGIDMDFSPAPCFDLSRGGGPDFSRMSNASFRVCPPAQRPVAVIPVSGGLALRGTSVFLPRALRRPGFEAAHARPNPTLTAPARLTCEASTLKDLKALTRRLYADGAPPLTFSLHSSTMTAGGNPYAQTPGDVARALDLCDAYFTFFKREFGGDFLTLDALADLVADRSS